MKALPLAVGLFGVLSTPAAAAPALALYGQLPAVEMVEISPDGARVAMVTTDGEQRRLVVTDAATQNPISDVDAGQMKVRHMMWADADNLIITTSSLSALRSTGGMLETATRRSEYLQGQVFNVPQQKSAPLIRQVPNNVPILTGAPMPRTVQGRTVVFFESIGFDDEGRGDLTLYRTDLARGQTALVERADEDARRILVDGTGQPVIQVLSGAAGPALKLRRPGKGWRSTPAPADAREASVLGLSPDGRAALVQYTVDGEEILGAVDLDSLVWTTEKKPLGHTTFYDPVTERFAGQMELRGDVETYTFANPADQDMWQAVQRAFPGERVTMRSWSDDRRKIIVEVDSPKEGPAFAIVNMDTKTSTWIALAYDGLTPAAVSPVQAISYKAADGQTITGYLTLPNGQEAKALPLVVLPHGGPASRDEPGFDWWSQALASRGYAVLRPNFRGSAGFGYAFLKSGYAQFGRKMQTDLSDGVRDLAAKGVIDPKRVCIAGASYGGYAALAGASIDRGVYRCAASVAGPSDLRRMLISDRFVKGDDAFRYWSRFMGVSGAGDDRLAEISPAAQADKIEIPVLLIHGRDDTVVRYEQSEIMAQAMRKAGKPVEFVTLDSEDHWLSRGATRLKMLQSLVAFLEKHNPPTLPAQTASLP